MIKGLFFYLTFIFGVIIGLVVSKYKIGQIKTEYNQKVDSLQIIVRGQSSEIKILEEMCRDKESEISYWGQKYDDCNSLK